MASPSRSASRSASPGASNRSRSARRSRSRSSPERYSRARRSRSAASGARSRSRSRSPNQRPTKVSGDRENPVPTYCIGIFGLNFKTTDADLQRAFGKYGAIEKVNVVLDGPSKRSRGFAFIYFETVSEAKKAKEAMDGTEIDGFQIRVDYSITDGAHKYEHITDTVVTSLPRPTPGVYFHHGRATRPGFRGRGEGRGGRGGRGEWRGARGRGEWRGRGGRGRGADHYDGAGPSHHREERYYDRRPPPPSGYYDRGESAAIQRGIDHHAVRLPRGEV
jgi:transformer-2 protein